MATVDSTSASEQRLRVRIIVADPGRPARSDPQVIHLGQQRDRLHWRAVVRVQDQRLLPALLADDAPLQQRRRLFTALLLMHFPAHPFAAVDVLYQIEVVILAADE